MRTRGSEAESKKVDLKGKNQKDRKESKSEVKKEASRDKTPAKSKRKPNIIIRNPAAITLSQFEILNKEQQEKKQNALATEKKSQPLEKSKEGDSSNSKSKCPNKGSPEVKQQSMFVFKTPQTKKQQNSMIFEVERKQARRFHHLQMCYNVLDQPLTIGPNLIISKQLKEEYQVKQNPQLSGSKEGNKRKEIMEEQQDSFVQKNSLKQEEEDEQHHSVPEKGEQDINGKEKKIKKRNKKRSQFEILLKQNNLNKLGAANTRSSLPSVQDKALTRNQLHKKYKFKAQIKKLGRPAKHQGR